MINTAVSTIRVVGWTVCGIKRSRVLSVSHPRQSHQTTVSLQAIAFTFAQHPLVRIGLTVRYACTSDVTKPVNACASCTAAQLISLLPYYHCSSKQKKRAYFFLLQEQRVHGRSTFASFAAITGSTTAVLQLTMVDMLSWTCQADAQC